MAGSHTIGIEVQLAKNVQTGLFGGEGFVLQRLTGEGDAFLNAGGVLIERYGTLFLTQSSKDPHTRTTHAPKRRHAQMHEHTNKM
jgi:hypothetical protein